jgi:hypothetical protein
MAAPDDHSTDVSVRQFVADSIGRRRAVPKEEVLATFATAPAVDADELQADLEQFTDQEVRDPFYDPADDR